ncbi:hypothetical protein C3481_07275 [Microbacterium sp. Ru50]|nr:hypothetical protein C3481_07275 [Microbacterium sp. Ru50]
MTDEESIRVASEAARRNVRGSLGSRSFHPRDAEMLVFDAAGQRAHAVEIWHAARAIGEEGNKSARAELRRRYGGRAPGVGWIGWVLVLAAICAALALVMSTGFRVPAENLEGVVVAVSVAAAVLVAMTLVGAAALTLGRGAVVAAPSSRRRRSSLWPRWPRCRTERPTSSGRPPTGWALSLRPRSCGSALRRSPRRPSRPTVSIWRATTMRFPPVA